MAHRFIFAAGWTTQQFCNNPATTCNNLQ